jgi:general secretion pathway protein I
MKLRGTECEVRRGAVRSADSLSEESEHAALIPHSALATSHLNGFTLLEVMVAVSIMAMVLVTLLGLKNRTMQDVMLARHMTTATMLAKRLMVETTTELKPSTPVEEEGVFPEEEFKDFTWKKNISLTPLVVTIVEVRIAVLWKEGTRQEMVELVSYE